MENKNSNKDTKKLAAKSLIEKGKKQGALTLGEIMEAFSEADLDKDKVENLYDTLGNLGIEVVESKNEKVDIAFSVDDELDIENLDDNVVEELEKDENRWN